MPRDKRFRSSCFTLNNYTDEEVEHIQTQDWKYIVFGYEVSSTGTPHLQGNAVSSESLTMSQWKKRLGDRAHIEATWAKDPRLASGYCRKDGVFFEKGKEPRPGERTDLQGLHDLIKSGEIDRQGVYDDYAVLYGQYYNSVNEWLDYYQPLPPCPDIQLMPWQQALFSILEGPVHDREIHFVVDCVGDAGKSTFQDYIESKLSRVHSIDCGKAADMAQTVIAAPRIVLMDVERGSSEFLNYPFLEKLKNGRVFRSKYKSKRMRFAAPHVMVFMNVMPDEEKLSADRIVIHDISEVPRPGGREIGKKKVFKYK